MEAEASKKLNTVRTGSGAFAAPVSFGGPGLFLEDLRKIPKNRAIYGVARFLIRKLCETNSPHDSENDRSSGADGACAARYDADARPAAWRFSGKEGGAIEAAPARWHGANAATVNPWNGAGRVDRESTEDAHTE